MIYTLENNNLKINVSSHGAEIHSITSKIDNTEYLWNGNKNYWGYHAPVLFPIVGKVKEGIYRVEGKNYELPQHGLARTREFELVERKDNSLSFELRYNEDTLKVYPYKFSLIITYTLIENGVITAYTVENKDDKTIYFSIGAHPAFMCPMACGEIINDYYLQFNDKENSETMILNKDGYITHERKDCLNDTNIIPLSFEVFKDDALIFDDLKSNEISLRCKNHDKSITMNFTGFPYMGIWTKPTGAPFVCIEPWYGHADYNDFSGELKDKEGIQSLKVNEIFNAAYTVTI